MNYFQMNYLHTNLFTKYLQNYINSNFQIIYNIQFTIIYIYQFKIIQIIYLFTNFKNTEEKQKMKKEATNITEKPKTRKQNEAIIYIQKPQLYNHLKSNLIYTRYFCTITKLFKIISGWSLPKSIYLIGKEKRRHIKEDTLKKIENNTRSLLMPTLATCLKYKINWRIFNLNLLFLIHSEIGRKVHNYLITTRAMENKTSLETESSCNYSKVPEQGHQQRPRVEPHQRLNPQRPRRLDKAQVQHLLKVHHRIRHSLYLTNNIKAIKSRLHLVTSKNNLDNTQETFRFYFIRQVNIIQQEQAPRSAVAQAPPRSSSQSSYPSTSPCPQFLSP